MKSCHANVPVIDPEIIKAHHLTASVIAVWFALSSFCQWEYRKGQPVRSKPGSCFPTNRAIAERAACSDFAVRSALAKLEALGYIKRVARYGRKNKGEKGEQRSNEYILFAEPQPKA